MNLQCPFCNRVIVDFDCVCDQWKKRTLEAIDETAALVQKIQDAYALRIERLLGI